MAEKMVEAEPPPSPPSDADLLVLSNDPLHPANHIPSLCAQFYQLGWVGGTGGGTSILQDDKIYIAPSGVQKELIKPRDIFVVPASCAEQSYSDKRGRIHHRELPYLRKPEILRPSACTPLFMTAFRIRGAKCCIHTHSHWAVMATLLVEKDNDGAVFPRDYFEISHIEQIKGIPKGPGKSGNLDYYDKLRIPIIQNTPKEEDLTGSLEAAMIRWPDTHAVLVNRHGIYVWGDNVAQAKTICESLDYLFRLAVDMDRFQVSWTPQAICAPM